MSPPDALLKKLKEAVRECEQVFEARSIAAKQKTGTERHARDELLTRAYLVLAHAALEEFFELLAQHVADESLRNWAGQKKSVPASALLLAHGEVDGELAEMEPKFTDRARKALDAGIGHHKTLINSNHGISLNHLRSLFYPLGVDLPDDTRMVSAIEELRKIRGDSAHRMRTGLSDLKSMKEWLDIVSDCLSFCTNLVQSVKAIQW